MFGDLKQQNWKPNSCKCTLTHKPHMNFREGHSSLLVWFGFLSLVYKDVYVCVSFGLLLFGLTSSSLDNFQLLIEKDLINKDCM